MLVIEGFDHHPRAALRVQRRQALRRGAVEVRARLTGERAIALERLDRIPRSTALAFRPRLREACVLAADRVTAAPFVIGLDAFEVEVLALADGQTPVAELARLAAAAHAPADAEPEASALRLLAALGRHDMLVTGA